MSICVLPVDLVVQGNLTASTFSCPANSISDAGVSATAGIQATKLIHQHEVYYSVAGTVATATVPVHIAHGDGAIVACEVSCITAPTGGDKAFSVDVQVGNQSTAFASVLSSALSVSSTTADREVKTATITTPDYDADDTIELVITASGSTGSNAAGVVVVLTLREEA